MGSIFKATLVFRFNPGAQEPGVITPPRFAGWTENYWYPAALNPFQFATLATKRAGILGTDCAVIGWRLTPYTYTNNQLAPARSSVGAVFAVGKFNSETNSPQDTLRMRCLTVGNANSWTLFLHAVPDTVIESNSYIANNGFSQALTALTTFLTTANLGVPAISWLGRDKTQQAQRVMSVLGGVAGTITTAVALAGIGVGQFIRLNRVYADNGLPIKGSYVLTLAPIVNANGTVTYTVAGLPVGTVRSTPSGTARLDQIATATCQSMSPILLASRKVGRPTLLFHGRRARVRA